jgi:hypothetical protein
MCIYPLKEEKLVAYKKVVLTANSYYRSLFSRVKQKILQLFLIISIILFNVQTYSQYITNIFILVDILISSQLLDGYT